MADHEENLKDDAATQVLKFNDQVNEKNFKARLSGSVEIGEKSFSYEKRTDLQSSTRVLRVNGVIHRPLSLGPSPDTTIDECPMETSNLRRGFERVVDAFPFEIALAWGLTVPPMSLSYWKIRPTKEGGQPSS